MHEYDLYVPLYANGGTRIAATKLRRLKKTLIKHFGGLTEFPQEQRGFWKVGKVTFRDKIVIWRVLSNEPAAEAKRLWATIKTDVAREWRQKEVLVVRRMVTVL